MKILYFGRIHLKNTLGFTLVELLVVLALVGILAGLAVPKFIDINDTASKNALDAAVIDLNGREKVTWAEHELYVEASRELVKTAPAYDPVKGVTAENEEAVRKYLEGQKKAILQVKEEMLQSLAEGQEILKN